jgi:ATP-binding cassette subfamily B protein
MLGILSLLIVDALQLVFPIILGRITDTIQSREITKNSLVTYSFVIVAISLGIALFRFFWRYLVFGVARKIETILRERFYSHLQKLSVNYYHHHKTGDLMAHATNDINNIRMMLGQGVAMSVDSLLIPVIAISMMFRTVGLKLTLACFFPMIILGVVLSISTKSMHNRIQKVQEAFSLLSEKAMENFSGIRVVKAFAQESAEVINFDKANQNNRETNLRYMNIMRILFPLVMSIASLSFAVSLLYGGVLVIKKQITLGDFVSFNSYLGLLIWPIAALGWITNIFQRGIVSLDRINAIMDEVPDIKDQPDPKSIDTIKGKINFKDLNFTYPGSQKQVLKNINITIESGETLAIVGRTGSGKSTLINLIPRLFNAPEGTLYIDDMEINSIPISILRKSIGYVPQDTFLFSSTIKENIDFFHDKDEKDITAAARIASVYDNIMEFPGQFNTMVGERGITLSGGQKQRISIARAIITEPSILILDDCLSAVDTHTEEEILKGLKQIMLNRTSIIVSHRISTIRDANEIIVLEDGQIAERGTHEFLLNKHGIYYDMYQKQLLSEQIEGVE